MKLDSGDPIVVVAVLLQNSDLESGAERTVGAS